jgi:hypothetical protein
VLIASGCSADSRVTDCGGTDVSDDGASMVASWASGTCPADGSKWGGFVAWPGLPTATSVPPGEREAMVPTEVNRLVLCSFTGSTGSLVGSAMVTDEKTVARMVGDLNSVISINAGCAGTGRVMILAGRGTNVLGVNTSIGNCTALNGPPGVADYGGTSLGADMDAVLGSSAAK